MNKKLLLLFLASLISSTGLLAQGTVRGTVTDAGTGETLPGVNVIISELTIGAATDVDGNYRIANVPAGTYTLVASFVGYQKYEASVTIGASGLVHDIELQVRVAGLDDVVVTAFGIQRERRALGYGVSEIGSESIVNQNVTDLSRVLTGKLPGVDISVSGGVTGSGSDIVIRGFSTLTGSNQPLIIVDGVRFDGGSNAQSDWYDGGGSQSNPNRLLDINPSNIADVSVLKGLSATVLYGEEGRNGVIIITTKTGQFSPDALGSGFQVTFDQSVYATQISSRPDYQNTYGGGSDQNFGWFYGNWGPRFDTRDGSLFGTNFVGYDTDGTVLIKHPLMSHAGTRTAFPEYSTAGGYKGYRYEPKGNPLDEFFRTGMASNTNLSISGGTENLALNLSYGRNAEDGFTPNNSMTRDAFSIGASYKVFDKLTAQTTFNMSLTDVKSPPISAGYGSGSYSTTSIFADVFYTPRNVDLNMPYQNPVTLGSAYYRGGNDMPHPKWTAEFVKTANITNRYYGQTALNLAVTDNVNLSYRMGYDSYTEQQSYKQNPGGVRPDDFNENGFYQTINIDRTGWDHNLNAMVDFQLTQDISLDGTLGAQYITDKYDRNGIESQQMVIFDFWRHSNFLSPSSSNSFLNNSALQSGSEKATAGVFGEFTLGYQDFVYLNIAGRNDWFSTLEPEHNSIFYPSASLSYILTDHLGISSDVLTYAKIFGGYGTSAGSPGPYNTRSTLASNSRAYIQSNGNIITTNSTSSFLGNPELKPELHKEFELGVDLRLFNNRVGLSGQVYTRTTSDLITSAPLDPATGYTSTLVNIGEIKNDGLELTLIASPIVAPFRWDATVNFSKNTSEVISTGDQDRIQVGGGFSNRGNFAVVGEPFMAMYGGTIERVTQDMVDNKPGFSGVKVGTPLVNAAGNYIESDEIGLIGNPNPDWNSSFINTFSYKNASLSFQFDYQQGGDMFSIWISTMLARGITTDTDVDRYNTFIMPGVNENTGLENTVQIASTGVFFDNYGFGTDELRVYDMTHIRLANIAFTYSLPVSLIEKLPINGLDLSITADNLWYYAFNVPKGSGFDPGTNSISGTRGFEYQTGPGARRFGGKITLRF